MPFCALSMTASRSLSFCRLSVVCLVAVCIEVPRCWVTASSRSCTELCNCVCALASSSPMAWTRRAQFDDPLVGELRGGGLLGRKLRRGGSARRALPPDEDGEAGNGEADDQAESDEQGGFHGRVLRDSLWREGRAAGDSRQEQIENTLTVRSPALKSRPRWCMAVRDILILPDKRLRLVSKPVAKIDAATRKLVEDMFETMYDAPGIGLAAIQIGEPRRIVTMDLAKKDEPKEPQVFINPELICAVRTRRTSTRKAASRSRNITRRSSGRRRSRSAISISTASSTRSRRTACWRPASSTRSTTSTACCSSITSPSSSATASSRNSPRRRSWASQRQTRGGVSDAAPPDLHGHAGFRRADAARTGRAGPRHRRGLYAGGRSPAAAAAWSSCRRRSSARRDGSALPVHTPASLKSADAQAAFAAHQADAAVVVAYGLILPKPILDAPPLGCFNLHASLLPRWRGAAPINRAIMAGDAETGVTVMKMDEGLDTGADGDGRARADRRRHDRGRLARRAGAARRRPDGARARRAGARHACSSRRSRPTASPMRRRSTRPRRASTGRKPWQAVHDHIRGLSPFPGAWCEMRGRPGQGAAHDQRRGQRRARHGARRSASPSPAATARCASSSCRGPAAADARRGIPARHARSPGLRAG